MLLLDLAAGLRRGELLALQWDDLNFKTGVLTINKQVYEVRGKLEINTPKTKASIRQIILPPASTILGHVSAATTLDIYTHITSDMQRMAAANIDRGIGKVEPTAGSASPQPEQPKNVYAKTKEECEVLLSGLIAEMKVEIQAVKESGDMSAIPDRISVKRKQIAS